MTEYDNPVIEQIIKELKDQLNCERRLTNSRIESMKESEIKIRALEEAIKAIESQQVVLSVIPTKNVCAKYVDKKSWWKQLWK